MSFEEKNETKETQVLLLIGQILSEDELPHPHPFVFLVLSLET